MDELNNTTLTPELRLKLYLMQHGYPSENIPLILRYCPQLIQKYTLEQIAVAALSDIRMFNPSKSTIYIRPFVFSAARQDLERGETITDFIEQSMSIFANETIELTFSDMIAKLLRDKGLNR